MALIIVNYSSAIDAAVVAAATLCVTTSSFLNASSRHSCSSHSIF